MRSRQTRPRRAAISDDSLLPNVIPQQTDDGENDQAKVKHSIRPQRFDESLVFEGKADQGRDDRIEGKGDHGEDERTWDRRQGVFRPQAVIGERWVSDSSIARELTWHSLGDECRFAKHG